MLRHTFPIAVVASLAGAGALACTDRPPTAPTGSTVHPAGVAATLVPPEQLARALALALRAPEFRAHLKARLDQSPVREHKLHFQRFLAADQGRAAQVLAHATGVPPADIARQAGGAMPLETYLPVPEHRRAWTGDTNVLVATALRDHDAPVAFDVQGNRLVLSPDQPPATPVIALVPVETDFTSSPQAPRVQCLYDCGGGGPPAPPPPPGLYMTKSHFVDDFEGWLKGSPEFEAHILGQKGQTDSLTDYQCAGEHASGSYYFDQNNLDWSGSVLLFTTTQIANYNAAHPGQNMRVFFVEDDDTACQIKTDNDLFKALEDAVDGANQALTAGKDTTSSTAGRIWKFAKALQKLFTALASLLNTNDELVGNAVQDSITGEYRDGFNWIVKGEKNVTNGWIKLEMR